MTTTLVKLEWFDNFFLKIKMSEKLTKNKLCV